MLHLDVILQLSNLELEMSLEKIHHLNLLGLVFTIFSSSMVQKVSKWVLIPICFMLTQTQLHM